MPSSRISATRMRGLSERVGVLEDDLHRARAAAAARARDSVARSRPSKRTLPQVGGDQLQERLADGGLAAARLADQRQRAARRASSNDTPSTAFTWPTVRLKTPLRIGKWTLRSLTSSRAAAAAAPSGASCVSDAGAPRCAAPAAPFSAQVAAREMPRRAARAAAAPRPGSARRRTRSARRSGSASKLRGERRHLAADHRELAGAPLRRRQRVEQLLRIRMLRRAQEGLALGELDDLAGVHDRHAVRHLRDDAEVVGDQQQRHAALGLQLRQQVEDLRLDGDVERGGRLVGDQHLGLARPARRRSSRAASGRRRAGTDTRRSAARRPGCRPRRSSSSACSRAPPCRERVCRSITSAICAPDGEHRVQRGRRAPGRSSPRACRAPRASPPRAAPSRSTPSQRRPRPPAMRPASGSSRMSDSAVIDLPQPDSPTSAKHSPVRSSKSMPSTARTLAGCGSVEAPVRQRFATSSAGRAHAGTAHAHPRIEAVAHRVGEQVGRQHQHEHEDERRARATTTPSARAPSPGARR